MKILVAGDFHGRFPKRLKKAIEKEHVDFILGVGDYAGVEEWQSWLNYVFNLNDSVKRKSPEEFYGKKRFKELMKKDFEKGEEVLLGLDSLGVPGFYVFGNGDDEWYDYPFDRRILQARKSRVNFLKRLKNLKEMTYGIRNFRKISFLGFGGYMDASANYERRKNKKVKDSIRRYHAVMKRVNRSKKKFLSLLNKVGKNKIFVFHYPPKGFFDIIKGKNNPYAGGSAGIDFFTQAIKRHKPLLAVCGHMHEYQGVKKLGKTLIINPGAAVNGKAAIVEINDNKKVDVKFIK